MNRDDELGGRLADTLDRSLETIDADALARLAHARRDALNRRTRVLRAVTGLAVAASLAAVAVVPWYLQQRAQKMDADMRYLTVDPQMLSDMDMLLVLGESDTEA